jgi:hypothetical protein
MFRMRGSVVIDGQELNAAVTERLAARKRRAAERKAERAAVRDAFTRRRAYGLKRRHAAKLTRDRK